MIVARTRDALVEGLARLRSRPASTLSLVPTMGALHEGHLSLVDRARSRSDAVALTIFVNPTQFGPGEDLDAYPRTLDDDLEKARGRGVSLVFAPESEEVVYPDGPPRIEVDPGPMGRVLCGAHRPGHFRGVLTVVAKLLGLFRPHVAVFGRKDFQQAVLIRRMVRDLELDVEIEVAPLVREDDGLALSSRNAYLGADERAQAVGLHEGLERARTLFEGGTTDPATLVRAVEKAVAERPLLRLQYASVVDPEALTPVDPAAPGNVMAVAAFCGDTRLIDNVVLGENHG